MTEIALLKARYELAYCVFGSEAQSLNSSGVTEQEGCASFGLLPEMTANGHTMIGQTWDWLEKLRGRVFVMRVERSAESAAPSRTSLVSRKPALPVARSA